MVQARDTFLLQMEYKYS